MKNRSVSNLTFISKVIERVVADQVVRYLQAHNAAGPARSQRLPSIASTTTSCYAAWSSRSASEAQCCHGSSRCTVVRSKCGTPVDYQPLFSWSLVYRKALCSGRCCSYCTRPSYLRSLLAQGLPDTRTLTTRRYTSALWQHPPPQPSRRSSSVLTVSMHRCPATDCG